MYDIIIIGAGTAGMTAAIYGRRAGKTVLLLEEGIYGGQIVNTPEVENYPGIPKISGFQFAMNLYEQIMALGAELENGKVVEIQKQSNKEQSYFVLQTEKSTFEAEVVILATGARNRKLELNKEEALTGKGISYCAACDGAFYKGKTVAVVGGGNTALGDAEYLSNICKQVYLIHRRDEFRGDSSLVDQLQKKANVTLLRNAVVTELIGTRHLEQIQVETVATKVVQMLAVDGLFVAVGQTPANQAFANIVELDSYGYIVAGEDCKTSMPGMFTAGDCRRKNVRQLTTATADGAVAAMAAVEYLNERIG